MLKIDENCNIGDNQPKWRLKDGIDFNLVNKKSIMNFDFDLTPYYNKETRIFEYPNRYIDFSCMGQVFTDFLFILDLVEKASDGINE